MTNNKAVLKKSYQKKIEENNSNKKDSTEFLSIKDFQKKYFWDFPKNDNDKQNQKKLMLCCQ